jgi:hypothetical protein
MNWLPWLDFESEMLAWLAVLRTKMLNGFMA